ncbi:MAG: phosphatidylglycerophosphatase A [Pyrinomonadaceae bacterium]|nr:phosphatidylglycerophosphatase A [Pyrinomonadaceae bacterium]
MRSIKDFFALGVATCGVGYLPLAPGTWGSLVAVGYYLILRWAVFGSFSNSMETADAILHWTFLGGELVAIAVVSVLGIWGAARTERILKVKDPGKVVIDEVAGQLIAMLAIPLVVDKFWVVWLILAFLLFRLFDITKPYPARRFESLPGGLGIMADDWIAGIYAALVLALVVALRGFV